MVLAGEEKGDPVVTEVGQDGCGLDRLAPFLVEAGPVHDPHGRVVVVEKLPLGGLPRQFREGWQE
jgi:hypothetical protein